MTSRRPKPRKQARNPFFSSSTMSSLTYLQSTELGSGVRAFGIISSMHRGTIFSNNDGRTARLRRTAEPAAAADAPAPSRNQGRTRIGQTRRRPMSFLRNWRDAVGFDSLLRHQREVVSLRENRLQL